MTNSASRQKSNAAKNVTSPRKGAKVQQSKLEMQQSTKGLRSLSNSTKNSKQQKEAEHRKEQPAKDATNGQIKTAKIPPPAPTNVMPTKGTTTLKKAKSVAPAKNTTTQTKNATPVKGVPLLGSWAGPVPASVVLSRPSAMVSSAPKMSARAGNGGRAILSRAI
ncbi:hypothetical protein PF005_g11281 [Phytophthora fragariae]|uniref:Uncharacterized protein n=1 Tax=Phytophthora fragariae TaxID=53985 RepID=A0A6A3Y3F0_9STRA|nr:hypothetical protein PF003_g13890 [Phytophthora fragariae]KAE9210776.1 hypothetical protein PF005_g11281 [Phytophthora fragariae]